MLLPQTPLTTTLTGKSTRAAPPRARAHAHRSLCSCCCQVPRTVRTRARRSECTSHNAHALRHSVPTLCAPHALPTDRTDLFEDNGNTSSRALARSGIPPLRIGAPWNLGEFTLTPTLPPTEVPLLTTPAQPSPSALARTAQLLCMNARTMARMRVCEGRPARIRRTPADPFWPHIGARLKPRSVRTTVKLGELTFRVCGHCARHVNTK
jgi:hypothetical protein